MECIVAQTYCSGNFFFAAIVLLFLFFSTNYFLSMFVHNEYITATWGRLISRRCWRCIRSRFLFVLYLSEIQSLDSSRIEHHWMIAILQEYRKKKNKIKCQRQSSTTHRKLRFHSLQSHYCLSSYYISVNYIVYVGVSWAPSALIVSTLSGFGWLCSTSYRRVENGMPRCSLHFFHAAYSFARNYCISVRVRYDVRNGRWNRKFRVDISLHIPAHARTQSQHIIHTKHTSCRTVEHTLLVYLTTATRRGIANWWWWCCFVHIVMNG